MYIFRSDDGAIHCKTDGLKGAKDFSALSECGGDGKSDDGRRYGRGITWIHNAAREPEVRDLAGFLEAMGVTVYGAGTEKIGILGKMPLRDARYRVMPDRVVAGTYLLAAAGAGGGD